MKTLLIKFTPRNEASYTKKLVDHSIELLKKAKQKYEIVDLDTDVPPLMLSKNVAAYTKRHYMGQKLTPAEQKTMKEFDRLTAQFKSADIVIVAYPMYNFSFPAVVKAYFDAVMLKGETWDNKEGKFIGLMSGKKAMILSASGGDYTNMPAMEHGISLAKVCFQFMGFSDIRDVPAAGVMRSANDAEKIVTSCKEKITKNFSEWYK